ncbi:MAG: PQQ-binding-like beta-propeller repeat protein, partial [Planctomycetales bacterium]|nr:PQQ-binding-like beta-propeller repeat protein [Planctomycetales bacterium]
MRPSDFTRQTDSAVWIFSILVFGVWVSASRSDDWPQLLGNSQHSGNASACVVPENIGLIGAVPLTDAVMASPVVSDGRVFVVDGSGVVTAVDAKTLDVLWRFETRGGHGNCNNVATPAVVGNRLHVGTMAGYYNVLDVASGDVIREVDCKEPIFSAPVVGDDRVYFATLGAQVYAVKPDGETIWTWDFVEEVIEFDGNRWSGKDWLEFRGDRVTWRDHFVCSRNICLVDKTVVIPAGGRTVFLEDRGSSPQLKVVGEISEYAGTEFPATFGQSADDDGNVYVQWHRRDNAGRVEVLRLNGENLDSRFVPETETSIDKHGLLSFASVSVRDGDVYRVKPEQGKGLVRHGTANGDSVVLCEAPSICPPVLTKEHAVYGGLDGKLYIVPLSGGDVRSFATAFGSPIIASVAIADERIYAACEDGYLYVFGANGSAELPTEDLQMWKPRSKITGKWADPKFDWYTNYGDFGGTNANEQGLEPPLRMRWARRLEGTVKHLPVCGGGRLYVHTAEGQILAVEQDTGRLLWRRYWPNVYLSFTSPLYHDGKLLVPQAGLDQSRVRCLDAAAGDLIWETPFTGSPSWSRQFPPMVHNNVVIYASGSGEYAAQGTETPFIFRGE